MLHVCAGISSPQLPKKLTIHPGIISDNTSTRTLSARFYDLSDMTVEVCQALCASGAGYSYAGVEFGSVGVFDPLYCQLALTQHFFSELHGTDNSNAVSRPFADIANRERRADLSF